MIVQSRDYLVVVSNNPSTLELGPLWLSNLEQKKRTRYVITMTG